MVVCLLFADFAINEIGKQVKVFSVAPLAGVVAAQELLEDVAAADVACCLAAVGAVEVG